MQKRKSKKLNHTVKAILVGCIVGLTAAIIALLFSSFILVKNDIDPSYVKYIWVIIYFVLGCACGFTVGRTAKSKIFLWGFLTALAVALVLFIVCTTVVGFKIDAFAAVLIPTSAIAGTLSAILSSNI